MLTIWYVNGELASFSRNGATTFIWPPKNIQRTFYADKEYKSESNYKFLGDNVRKCLYKVRVRDFLSNIIYKSQYKGKTINSTTFKLKISHP